MKWIILVLGAGLVYLIFISMAKSQEVPLTECEKELGAMMEVAGDYITWEARARQQIEDLKVIIRELQSY